MELYLKTCGWDVEADYRPHEWRRELHRRLRRAIVSFPTTPMPHGKIVGHLWTLFPGSARRPDEFFTRLPEVPEWQIIPESPGEPNLRLRNPGALPAELPRTDLYLLCDGLPDIVLAIDHEGEGPWVVDLVGPKHRVPSYLVPERLPDRPAGTELDARQSGRIRAWIRNRLREKGCFVPRYPLAKSGAAKDYVWNYMPEVLDASLGRGSLVEHMMKEAERLAVWTDHLDPVWLVAPGDVQLDRLWDAYYLDWPDRRWLVAVPGQKLKWGEDSPVGASFVALK